MLREFYEYISKRIIQFFQENDDNILNGARYCLTLNSQDAVDNLESIFYEYAETRTQVGIWDYTPPNSTSATYQTFTLDFQKNKVAIVLKSKDMTEDFLATLRNTKKTMIMITASPIDSVLKGTDNLANKGFPFHRESIVADMQCNIENSLLSDVDKAILEFEINRHDVDIYGDTTTIFEYENVLAILNNKSIEKEDFSTFRLFYDDKLVNFKGKKLKERIEENNKRFELIDKTIKYGDVEKELDKYYDNTLINELSESDSSTWFNEITYEDIINSSNKKENSKDNILLFEDCIIFSETLLDYTFNQDSEFFISQDGTTTNKKRNNNILIFNKDKKRNLTIQLNFNRAIKQNEIVSCENIELKTYKKSTILEISHDKDCCTFHNVKINDNNSKNVKYDFKICVIDFNVCYFKNLLTSYTIKYEKKNPKINITCDQNDISINTDASNTKSEDVRANSTYNCSFDYTTKLKINEDLFTDNDGKIKINICVGSVDVPLLLLDEAKKSTVLTPLNAFKYKNKMKSNFRKIAENTFISGTKEFFLHADFLNDIKMEEYFIKNGAYNLIISEVDEILEPDISLPKDVEISYNKLISYYADNNLLPSLTYYSEELISIATEYINSIKIHFDRIIPNQTLSSDIRNIIKLGTIQHYNKSLEFCLTPFNPLALYYILTLHKYVRD